MLKIRRIESGLRQLDLAKKTGIPEWRITKLETCRAVPKQEEIDKLRAVLGDF